MPVEWTRTDRELPPNGATVEAISERGYQTTLTYRDGIWWAEGNLYVYWTPLFWRLVQS